MTRPLITPNWPAAPVEVQRWMERVTQILTGNPQGGAPVVVDGASVAAAISASGEIQALSSNVQTVGGAASGGGLYATYSPLSLFAVGPAYTAQDAGPVTVTPVGGTGPYTHAWTLVSGEADAVPDDDTSDSPTFNCVTPGAGVTLNSVWRDTITDALAATYAVDISVTVSGRAGRGTL